MGIDANRFIGDSHHPFLCSVCLDVIKDPISTLCEHLFCKSCLVTPGRCPTCRQNVSETRPLSRVLKQIYESLRMKCLSTECQEQVQIWNYEKHDQACSKLFCECQTCGCRIRSLNGRPSSDHDCINYLKDKLVSLELELEENRLVESAATVLSLGGLLAGTNLVERKRGE